MSTPRIKQINALGKAVEDGLITQDEAVERLVEFSDGRFTKVGAEDVLRDWRNAESRYSDGR